MVKQPCWWSNNNCSWWNHHTWCLNHASTTILEGQTTMFEACFNHHSWRPNHHVWGLSHHVWWWNCPFFAGHFYLQGCKVSAVLAKKRAAGSMIRSSTWRVTRMKTRRSLARWRVWAENDCYIWWWYGGYIWWFNGFLNVYTWMIRL